MVRVNVWRVAEEEGDIKPEGEWFYTLQRPPFFNGKGHACTGIKANRGKLLYAGAVDIANTARIAK
jgi:hypothetical protein